MIKLEILGHPISKDNEKSFNLYGRPFKSKKYVDFEKNVKEQVRKQYIGKPLETPLSISIEFYFKDNRRCDLLNAPKSICDALNKLVWVDDKQIIMANLMLAYDKKNPRTILEIYQIGMFKQQIEKQFKN